MTSAILSSLAILIDAENISAALLAAVLTEAGKLGRPGARRAYADWAQPGMSGWKTSLTQFAIKPVQQFSHVAGKNAADMAMVIDAMDLLHAREHDGFCIVSSDSDFSGLAIRIRQEGIRVFGIGEAKAPKIFRQACDAFVEVGLGQAKKLEKAATVAVSAMPCKAPLGKADLDALRKAIREKTGTDGWAELSAVGSYLAQEGKISIRKHAANLSKLMRVSGIVDFPDFAALPGKPHRVRLKA